MHRIDTATKAPDLFGAGKDGFKDGNKAAGILATELTAAFFNDIQENLAQLIESCGMALVKGDATQVKAAIQQMINAGGFKMPVRAMTTGNIANLAGGAPNVSDGVSLNVGDRVFVPFQTTGSQNGLYVVTTLGTGSNGTWTRATDADGVGELFAGMLVVVSEGSTYADSIWELSTDGAINLGTTSLTFTRKDSSTSTKIQSVSASVAANALTLGLNPTSLDFRSSSLTNGTPNTRSIGSALTLVVPSGATLGTVSGQAARLALLAIDNAGTVELAVANLSGGLNLDETTLISTTAISAAATSAGVSYSTTARSNVPFRVVGFIDITEAIAGTWATAPTTIQGEGGQALAALNSLGFGQSWQNVTGSRAIGTTYYNTTGKPIEVSLLAYNTTLGAYMALLVNGVIAAEAQQQATYYSAFLTAIVPPGASYQHTNAGANGAIPFWSELR